MTSTAWGSLRFSEESHVSCHSPESRTRREEDVESVAADVVGLNLRYYDGQWKDGWNSTQTLKMPRAVEVSVHVKREEEIEVHTARFYLPVAGETPEAKP